jgi:hypothetical protein
MSWNDFWLSLGQMAICYKHGDEHIFYTKIVEGLCSMELFTSLFC